MNIQIPVLLLVAAFNVSLAVWNARLAGRNRKFVNKSDTISWLAILVSIVAAHSLVTISVTIATLTGALADQQIVNVVMSANTLVFGSIVWGSAILITGFIIISFGLRSKVAL
jgi:hypothetical protein